MKLSRNIKITLFSIVTGLTFVASICVAVLSSRYIPKTLDVSITTFINEECKNVDCGNIVFGKLDYSYSVENIDLIEKEQSTFNEPLNSQLSLSEFNVEISSIGKTKKATILETKTYDNHFDTIWIYSPTTMHYFDENIENVYISTTLEKELIKGTGLGTARGQKIVISANGISKDLLIGGTYLNNTYPNDRGTKARGEALFNAFEEPILMHKEIVKQFNPTSAIAMFGSNTTNSGSKFLSLKNLSETNKMQFSFNVNPLEGSTLNSKINKIISFYDSSTNKTSLVLMLVGSLLLEAVSLISLYCLLKNLKYTQPSGKKEILSTAIIGCSILLISFLTILIFKFVSFNIVEIIEISALNSVSIALALIPIVLTIVYFLFKRRKTILLLFKNKEDNTEFDY